MSTYKPNDANFLSFKPVFDYFSVWVYNITLLIARLTMQVKLISYTPNPEKHIEYCARICYDSNDKVSKTDTGKFLAGLLKSGHLSVFEHASASFYIEGVSRALTHQLVRHRLASYSQRSQRYVSETDFEYTIPPEIECNPDAKIEFERAVESIKQSYQKLRELGAKKEDARFLLPNAVHSTITMTANFREWLAVLDLRVSKHAQWEICGMAVLIWKELYKIAPSVFDITAFEKSRDFEYKKQIFDTEIS